MDMDQSAVFLAGSILTALGFIVLLAAVIVANNLLHKYWKPVKLITWNYAPPARFATEDELEKIAPSLDNPKTK